MRVPTLDIDFVWHTHQLFAKTYEHEVGRIVGRFVNQFVDFIYISTLFSDVFGVVTIALKKEGWEGALKRLASRGRYVVNKILPLHWKFDWYSRIFSAWTTPSH